MISKKNSALIFDPNFLFYKKLHKQTRILLLPFKKHEIFGGVAHVSHATKNYFNMTTCGFFFARSGGQRDVIFHETNIHKIICLIFND